MNDQIYISNKLRHCKILGVPASIDPTNGAVRTESVKAAQEEVQKRYSTFMKKKAAWKHFTREDEYLD